MSPAAAVGWSGAFTCWISGAESDCRVATSRVPVSPMRSIWPLKSRHGFSSQAKTANLMLEEPPLMVSTREACVNDGASGVPGVWINLGHGSSGWALACGSARVVADLVSGRAPEVDIEGLGIERLGA